LTEPEWNNSTVIAPNEIASAVTKLRDEVDGDVLVNGSVQLVHALATEGLVDEYRLMLFPTVLGTGKKLFGELDEPALLRLTESKPAGETLILIYRPA
jgi:dihydrofolate reductase